MHGLVFPALQFRGKMQPGRDGVNNGQETEEQMLAARRVAVPQGLARNCPHPGSPLLPPRQPAGLCPSSSWSVKSVLSTVARLRLLKSQEHFLVPGGPALAGRALCDHVSALPGSLPRSLSVPWNPRCSCVCAFDAGSLCLR